MQAVPSSKMVPDEDRIPYELSANAWKGIALFNSGEYSEAHEFLEAAWRDEPGDLRFLYQGILLAGVSIYHAHNGNLSGSMKTAGRALKHLSGWKHCTDPADIRTLYRDLLIVQTQLQKIQPGDLKSLQTLPGLVLRITQ